MYSLQYVVDLMGNYNPSQPRVPAGSPQGGEWSSGGGSGAVAVSPKASPKSAAKTKSAPAARESSGFPEKKTTRKFDAKVTSDEKLLKSADKLSSEEKKLIDRYTSGELNYKKMNKELREGKRTWAATDQINAAIDKAGPLPDGLITYRGINVQDKSHLNEMTSKFESAAKTGGTITMSGITSTSIDPGVAKNFAGHNSKAIMFEIKPKKGLYVGETLSEFGGEAEVILKHGAKYKVVGVQKDVMIGKKLRKGFGYTMVQLEEV